jgi:hypothetical protein
VAVVIAVPGDSGGDAPVPEAPLPVQFQSRSAASATAVATAAMKAAIQMSAAISLTSYRS